jgi:hypothetical protein
MHCILFKQSESKWKGFLQIFLLSESDDLWTPYTRFTQTFPDKHYLAFKFYRLKTI